MSSLLSVRKWTDIPFLLCVCMCSVAQSCPTFCDPMDCSPPGSSVHGILQARILEWVVIPFSKGSSPPRDWTLVSCTGVRLFTVWATRTYRIFCTLLGGGSDLLPEVIGCPLKNGLKNCLVILIWLDVCCFSLSLFLDVKIFFIGV